MRATEMGRLCPLFLLLLPSAPLLLLHLWLLLLLPHLRGLSVLCSLK